ncbi:MAG: hypothetical protein INQ03_13330 [Candidatus Heimdallarchaeota archaeon]|nr:hypothetical protein [Candidatus Heimdallarchaeota archaeon]
MKAVYTIFLFTILLLSGLLMASSVQPSQDVTPDIESDIISVELVEKSIYYNGSGTISVVTGENINNNYIVAIVTGSHGVRYYWSNLYKNDTSGAYEGTFNPSVYWTDEVYISEIYFYTSYPARQVYRNGTDFDSPEMTILGVTPDITAPTVNSIELTNSVYDCTIPSSISVKVNVTDDLVGYIQISGFLVTAEGEYYDSFMNSGSTPPDLEFANVHVDKFGYEGRIWIDNITITDGIGNGHTYYNGTDIELYFDVINILTDNEAPVITRAFFTERFSTFSLDDMIEIDEYFIGDEYSIYFGITVEVGNASVKYENLHVTYTNENGTFHTYFYLEQAQYQNELYYAYIRDASLKEGLYEIKKLELTDIVGNTIEYNSSNFDFPSLTVMKPDRKGKGIEIEVNMETNQITNVEFAVTYSISSNFTRDLRNASILMQLSDSEMMIFDFPINFTITANAITSDEITFSMQKGVYTLNLLFLDDLKKVWLNFNAIITVEDPEPTQTTTTPSETSDTSDTSVTTTGESSTTPVDESLVTPSPISALVPFLALATMTIRRRQQS